MFRKSLIIFIVSLATTVATVDAYCDILSAGFFSNKDKEKNQIVVSGKVSDPKKNSFELNYGRDSINVEIANWSFEDQTQRLKNGERVTVYGYIDESWFKKRKLKAQAVYVPDRNIYFLSSDDEDYYVLNTINVNEIPDDTYVSVKGKVIDIKDKKIIIKLGGDEINVDASDLSYSALSKEGKEKIKVGDILFVSGKLDSGFFDDKEIKAKYIVKIHLFNFK